jgi:pilus assembly protein FimV
MPVSRALGEVAEEPTAMGAAPEESTAPQPEQDSLDVASAASFSTMRDSEGGQVDAGLSLVPVSDLPEGSSASQGLRSSYQESVLMEESIYGLETDPIDSKLDLARAYLDMGDEAGARLVLSEVIKEGNLSQQAEARTLLLRLEVS